METRLILEKIKGHRVAQGISQARMADQLGMTLRTYQRLESGDTSLKVYQLFQILDLLSPSIGHYLFSQILNSEEVDRSINSKETSRLDKASTCIQRPQLADSETSIDVLKSALIANNDEDRVGTGYWEWNMTTSEVYWSTEMYYIYDAPKENKTIDFGWLCEHRIHPEDHEKVRVGMEELINLNRHYYNSHRVRHRELGEIRVNAAARKFIQDGHDIIFGIAQCDCNACPLGGT
jgi:transcriptional regulator with XRE-family HTH domain